MHVNTLTVHEGRFIAGLLDSFVLAGVKLILQTLQQHNKNGLSYPLPVAGVGVRVEPQQGLLVHDCSDRLAGHSWVSFSPRQVYSSLLLSGKFLSSATRTEKPEVKDTMSPHPSYQTDPTAELHSWFLQSRPGTAATACHRCMLESETAAKSGTTTSYIMGLFTSHYR